MDNLDLDKLTEAERRELFIELLKQLTPEQLDFSLSELLSLTA